MNSTAHGYLCASPTRETTRRSRRLRGQEPLSPKSPPAELEWSRERRNTHPPQGGGGGGGGVAPFRSPAPFGAPPPSLHLCFHNLLYVGICKSKFIKIVLFSLLHIKQNKAFFIIGMGLQMTLGLGVCIFLFPFFFMM